MSGWTRSKTGFLGKTPSTRQKDALYHNITLCRLPRREKRQLPPVVDGLNVVAEDLQPHKSTAKLARRHGMRRGRGFLDERVKEQETPSRLATDIQ